MDKKIILDEGKLNFILNNQSRSIVGKVCKRFELQDKQKENITYNELEIIKKNVRELIYEWARDVISMIRIADENSKKDSIQISKED